MDMTMDIIINRPTSLPHPHTASSLHSLPHSTLHSSPHSTGATETLDSPGGTLVTVTSIRTVDGGAPGNCSYKVVTRPHPLSEISIDVHWQPSVQCALIERESIPSPLPLSHTTALPTTALPTGENSSPDCRRPHGLKIMRPMWFGPTDISTRRGDGQHHHINITISRWDHNRGGVIRGQAYSGAALYSMPQKPKCNTVEISKEITSSITGRIVQINIKEGQIVHQRDCLMIIEAMKMENKIFAPISGKVIRVLGREGQGTTVGKVLCVLDPSQKA